VGDEVRVKVITLPARRPAQGDVPHLGWPGAAAVGSTGRALCRQELVFGQDWGTFRMPACV
jgi:hypothetical protein